MQTLSDDASNKKVKNGNVSQAPPFISMEDANFNDIGSLEGQRSYLTIHENIKPIIAFEFIRVHLCVC